MLCYVLYIERCLLLMSTYIYVAFMCNNCVFDVHYFFGGNFAEYPFEKHYIPKMDMGNRLKIILVYETKSM